jgi:hypothetical protein
MGPGAMGVFSGCNFAPKNRYQTNSMAEDKNNTHYFLDVNPEEAERLQLGQLIISGHMDKPIWTPLDLSQSKLKILDSATASGKIV